MSTLALNAFITKALLDDKFQEDILNGQRQVRIENLIYRMTKKRHSWVSKQTILITSSIKLNDGYIRMKLHRRLLI